MDVLLTVSRLMTELTPRRADQTRFKRIRPSGTLTVAAPFRRTPTGAEALHNSIRFFTVKYCDTLVL